MHRGALIAIAAASLFTAPAHAALVDVIWTGTVGPNRDELGLFGAPGGDLTGQRFVARFRYDTTVGFQQFLPESELVAGGVPYGGASPARLAQLTINHIRVDSRTDYAGVYGRSAIDQGSVAQSYSQLYSWVYDVPFILPGGEVESFDGLWFDYTIWGALIPIDLTAPYFRNVLPSEQGYFSNAYFGKFDLGGFAGARTTLGAARQLDSVPPSTQMRFIVETVRITAVPEPASWALMIAGFAMAGGALRRRRAAGHPAA